MSATSSDWPSLEEARAALQSSDTGRAILERLERTQQSKSAPASKQKDYRTAPYLVAATLSSYTLADLKETGADLIKPTLDDSVPLTTRRERTRRYALSDEARAAVFAAWAGSQQLSAALESASRRVHPDDGAPDVETRWFARLAADRMDVGAVWSQLDGLSLREMTDAARAAAKAQTFKKEIEPLAQEIRRRLALEEVIGALRMLIGTRSPVGQGGLEDNFVGREEELETLYAHVGVVPPATLARHIKRFKRRVGQAIIGRPRGALTLHAIGGMGKSSLIAKFVMAHVSGVDGGMPIVYLDFDRATLLAADAAALLAEMSRQVTLQVCRDGKAPLRRDAQEALAALEALGGELRAQRSRGEMRFIGDYVRRFTQQVDRLFPASQPFLLVLDTLERLQSLGASDMERVVRLTAELGLFDNSWSRLRVVASGRIDAVELREPNGEPAPVELQLLSAADSKKLAEKLLASAWGDAPPSPRVAEAIDESSRGYPLVVRLIVDLIAFSEPEKRQEIIADISSSPEVGASRVATVLYKRFAERVNVAGGALSVKVAVCLRRLTPSLMSDALAAATPQSAADANNEVYDALARDRTLWAETGPGHLRWRPDLRGLLLECVRAEDPGLLRQVSQVALEWSKKEGADPAAAAESVYYSLLAGEGVEAADRYWRSSAEARKALAGAAEDFPIASDERFYLSLRASARLPSPSEYRQLPPRVAWRVSLDADDSLALHGSAFIEPRIAILQNYERSQIDSDAATRAEYFGMLVKTGPWLAAEEMAIDEAMLASPIFREAFIYLAPRTPLGDARVELLMRCVESDPLETRSVGPGDGWVQRLVAMRALDDARWRSYDERVSNLHARRLRQSEESILLGGSFGAAAATWASEFFIEGAALQSLAKAQFLILHECYLEVDAYAGAQFAEIVGSMNGWVSGQLFASDDPVADATREAGTIDATIKALRDLRKKLEPARFESFVRRFCGVRDPDWTEPFGYALTRLYEEPEELREVQLALLKELTAKGALVPHHAELCASPSIIINPIAVLCGLDEAAAVPVFIRGLVDKITQKDAGWLSRTVQAARASLRRRASAREVAERQFLKLSRNFDRWRAAKTHDARL